MTILKRYGASLGVTAPDAALDATVALARAQLEGATISLSVADVTYADGRVTGRAEVMNRTGHKFPSGYPSRRAWMRVVAYDAADAVVFDAGGWDAGGRLVSGGALLPGEAVGDGFRAHVTDIKAASDVPTWEAIMSDVDGAPTIALLKAVRYLKDTRLLPSGWRADGPYADRTVPVGVDGDADFIAGSDSVRLDFPVASVPSRLVVSVHYQVLSPRWAAELFETPTPDVRAFEGMVDAVGLLPETVGAVEHRF